MKVIVRTDLVGLKKTYDRHNHLRRLKITVNNCLWFTVMQVIHTSGIEQNLKLLLEMRHKVILNSNIKK